MVTPATTPAEFKIVITGPRGAGKATASRSIGEGIAVPMSLDGSGRALDGLPPAAAGALGLIVLVDNSQTDPIAQVAWHLRVLAGPIGPLPTVVGVGRLETHPSPGVEAYCAGLEAAGWRVPVIDVDVRREADVRLLLSVLVGLAEADGGAPPE